MDPQEQKIIKCNNESCTYCYYGICHSEDVINEDSDCEYVPVR